MWLANSFLLSAGHILHIDGGSHIDVDFRRANPYAGIALKNPVRTIDEDWHDGRLRHGGGLQTAFFKFSSGIALAPGSLRKDGHVQPAFHLIARGDDGLHGLTKIIAVDVDTADILQPFAQKGDLSDAVLRDEGGGRFHHLQ